MKLHISWEAVGLAGIVTFALLVCAVRGWVSPATVAAWVGGVLVPAGTFVLKSEEITKP